MNAEPSQIEVGDLFEQTAGPAAGRRVRITRRIGLTSSALHHIQAMKAREPSPQRDAEIEAVRLRRTYYYVKTEVHPTNEGAVGRVSRVSEDSLAASGRYRKVKG